MSPGASVTLPPKSADVEHRDVLVVDDDADVRGVLVDFLSCQGVSTREAFDGLDALHLVRSGLMPCAIVLDVDMPRLSGPGLVAVLRADRALPRIPVITMTAGAAPQGLDTDGHLTKPFALDSMLRALFRICRSCGTCERQARAVRTLVDARRRAG